MTMMCTGYAPKSSWKMRMRRLRFWYESNVVSLVVAQGHMQAGGEEACHVSEV